MPPSAAPRRWLLPLLPLLLGGTGANAKLRYTRAFFLTACAADWEPCGSFAKYCCKDETKKQDCAANEYLEATHVHLTRTDNTCEPHTTCGKGEYLKDATDTKPGECHRCNDGTYQDSSNHRDSRCTNQPTCGKGEHLDDYSREKKGTCEPCPKNTFQDQRGQTSCDAQPVCAEGQYYTGDDEEGATKSEECKRCAGGTYQNRDQHRSTECKACDNKTCGSGTYRKGTCAGADNDFKCTPCDNIECGTNEYRAGTCSGTSNGYTCRTCSSVACPTEESNFLPCTAYPLEKHQQCPADFATAGSCAGSDCQEACPKSQGSIECIRAAEGRRYRTGQCSGTIDGFECRAQAPCAQGQYLSGYSQTTAGECLACPANTYRLDAQHWAAACAEQPVCGQGEQFLIIQPRAIGLTSISTKHAGECAACNAGSHHYQDETGHRSFPCKTQRPCPWGAFYVHAATEERSCEACPAGTFQDSESYGTSCQEQRGQCGTGTRLSAATLTADRECIKCDVGKYMDEDAHNHTACKEQPTCSAGQMITADRGDAVARVCIPCTERTYQPKENHSTQTACLSQPRCEAGYKYSADASKEALRECSACDPGTYLLQSGAEAFAEACQTQATCGQGTYISASTTTQKQTCAACAAQTFQDESGHSNEACHTQPGCRAGEFVAEMNQSSVMACSPCPDGTYQSEDAHFQTLCTLRPVCDAARDEFYLVAGNSTVNSVCKLNNGCATTTEYETGKDGQGKVTCGTLRTCGAGTYVAVLQTHTSDRQCRGCPAGQWQPKQNECGCKPISTCSAGEHVSATATPRTDVTCSKCVGHTYQDDPSHLFTACKDQPLCGAGTQITLPDTARHTAQSCVPCDAGRFHTSAAHRDTSCIEQVLCDAGSKFVLAENQSVTTSRGACTPCPPGTFLAEARHRVATCAPQGHCGAGHAWEDSRFEARKCAPCATNTYCADAKHQTPQCHEQQTCGQGQYFVGTATSRGECKRCAHGYYQQALKHRSHTCSPSPKCGAGQFLEPGDAAAADPEDRGQASEGACKGCAPGEYMDETQHWNLACKSQRMCGTGEGFTGGSASSVGACVTCVAPEFQHFKQHRQACFTATTCGDGMQYVTTPYTRQATLGGFGSCSLCPFGKYQNATAHRDTACHPKGQCPAGYRVLAPETSRLDRKCAACASGQYSNVSNAYACTPQPFCQAGAHLEGASTVKEGACRPCSADEYQDATLHRFTTCQPQMACGPGRHIVEVSNPTEVKLACDSCPPHTYKNASDHATACLSQPFCGPGEKRLSANADNDALAKSTCVPCDPGDYMDLSSHRESACLAQRSCTHESDELVGASAAAPGTCEPKAVLINSFERWYPQDTVASLYTGGLETNATYNLFAGTHYRIAPVRLVNVTNFRGELSNAKYALYDAPNGVFVGTSGEILAVPSLPDDQMQHNCTSDDQSGCTVRYDAQLVVVDGASTHTLVEMMVFFISRRPAFVVESFSRAAKDSRYIPSARGPKAAGSSAGGSQDVDPGGGGGGGEARTKVTPHGTTTNVFAVVDPAFTYSVKSTYRFVAIGAVTFLSSLSEAASYTIEGAPDGFLIEPSSGLIQGTPLAEGDHNMSLYVIGSGPMEKALLEVIPIRARFDDTHHPKYGPHGMDCGNGTRVDAVKFDKAFACDCTLSKYVGDNCNKTLRTRDEFREQNATEAMLRVGWQQTFFTREMYTIDGISSNKSQIFENAKGGIEDISYRLEFEPESPGGFLVDTATGRVTAVPDRVGNYSMSLVGTDDGNGESVEVYRWGFTVRDKPEFSIVAGALDTAAITANGEQHGYRATFTNGKTYNLKGPGVDRAELFKNFARTGAGAGAEQSVTYRIEFDTPSVAAGPTPPPPPPSRRRARRDAGEVAGDADSAGGPGHFFVDAQTGDCLANPTNDGEYTGKLFAVDASGAKVPVKTWNFSVVGACVGKTPASLCNDRGTPFVNDDYSCACTDCEASSGAYCETVVDTAGSGDSGSTEGDTRSIIIGAVFALVLCVLLFGFLYQRRRAYALHMKAFDFKVELDRLLQAGELEVSAVGEGSVPREISRSSITMTHKLGSGAFGEVWKAVLDESRYNGVAPHPVAVKTVRTNAGEAAAELFREATVMAQIAGPFTGHENLVQLVGAVTSGTPLLLLVSLCEQGSLLDVLKNDSTRARGGLPWNTKLSVMVGTARGMQHLASHRFVHRDLAARNVLIDAAWCAKVADFGLSRSVQQTEVPDDAEGGEGYYYRSQRGIFPVRWSAPESMQDLLFTSASDVWSFGVVVHEVLDDGKRPYCELGTNQEVISRVSGGYRMAQRNTCDDDLYRLLLWTWDGDPDKRPTFADIIDFFARTYDIEALSSGGGPSYVPDLAGAGAGAGASPSLPTNEYEYDGDETTMGGTSIETAEDGYLRPSTATTEDGYLRPSTAAPAAGPGAGYNGAFAPAQTYAGSHAASKVKETRLSGGGGGGLADADADAGTTTLRRTASAASRGGSGRRQRSEGVANNAYEHGHEIDRSDSYEAAFAGAGAEERAGLVLNTAPPARATMWAEKPAAFGAVNSEGDIVHKRDTFKKSFFRENPAFLMAQDPDTAEGAVGDHDDHVADDASGYLRRARNSISAAVSAEAGDGEENDYAVVERQLLPGSPALHVPADQGRERRGSTLSMVSSI